MKYLKIIPMLICFLLITVNSMAAVTTEALYLLGEDDPGAVIGNAATSTVDSTGTLDLQSYGGVYTSGIAPGSTIAISGNVQDSNFEFTYTNNFGLEGYYYYQNSYTGNNDLVLNGTSSYNGWGLIQANGTYGGLYGGVAYLDTGISANVGDVIYMALVRNAGQTSVYFKDIGAGGPLQTFNFGGIAPNTPSGIFSIRPGSGVADDVRVFTFQPGAFDSSSDLLVNQAPIVPEPISSTLFIVGGATLGFRRFRKKLKNI